MRDLCKARFIRCISAVSNAIQTKDNEANHLIISVLSQLHSTWQKCNVRTGPKFVLTRTKHEQFNIVSIPTISVAPGLTQVSLEGIHGACMFVGMRGETMLLFNNLALSSHFFCQVKRNSFLHSTKELKN